MEIEQKYKKRIFSGVQPSGTITLGNYLGAIKNWVALQDEYECIYSVVDLHAITVRQEPSQLRMRCMELLAMLLACGINPDKSLLFIQSQVPEHAQLAWILSTYTQMGELQRMTQFKDKSAKNENNINAGLFTYPILMAADILLYLAELVPVGEDQKQHLELTRDVAQRFNSVHGDVFKIPEPYIPKVGARVMSLQNPLCKMSKSDENAAGYISLSDTTDVIIKKFKRAVTDSEAEVVFRAGKDGICNLMSIYSSVSGRSISQIESDFSGKGYGDFKSAVGEAVAEHIRPVQEKYADYLKNKDYLNEICAKSAQSASRLAGRTLSKVYKKVGFVLPG